MTTSLTPLIQFHVNEIEQTEESASRFDELSRSLSMLRFAQATELKQQLSAADEALPLQVVAVGPTQAGKSTLVNLLLGQNKAAVSAHAGYTVHCQGFALEDADTSWLGSFFTDASLVEQSSLQRDVLDEYSCTTIGDRVESEVQEVFKGKVLWDTPDFDSVTHTSYRGPVLQSVALADLVIMVVSKEKYADKSVWDMLKTLSLAGKEVILVVNKTPAEIRQQLSASVSAKLESLSASLALNFTPPVYFIDETENPLSDLQQCADIIAVRESIRSLQRQSLDAQQANLQRFVNNHWRGWTALISQRHANQGEWKRLVDESCESMLQHYVREYLENKRHDETLQLAVAELLVLLEIPGLAVPLTRIRNLVTWPVRKVFSTATQIETSSKKKDSRSEEQRLLESLYDHCLTELVSQVASRRQTKSERKSWWGDLQTGLEGARPVLKQGWDKESANYQTLLKVETERAARSLYKKLEEQPATLNSLRAARVSADAAAVVLAVKSGGLGAADLVIAPAVLSLTTMLTESALGQYMQKVQQDLKRYQKKSVNGMINRKLKIKLHALAGSSSSEVTPSTLSELAGNYHVTEAET